MRITIGFQKADPPAAVMPRLWKVKHDAELGKLWRSYVPEVFRFYPSHAIPMDRRVQELSFQMNPGMDPKKWRTLYGYYTAFTNNGAGYDRPGDPPKQDWINMRDTLSPYLPKFDQPRMCGGTILSGAPGYSGLQAIYDGAATVGAVGIIGLVRSFSTVVSAPNILWMDTIRPDQYVPTVHEVPVWHKFCAVNVRPDGISRFPQGGGRDVWVPLLSMKPAYCALSILRELDPKKPLPSPYTIETG